MKRKLELLTLVILYFTLGYFTLHHDHKSIFILLHNIFLLLGVGAFVFGNAYYFIYLLKRKAIKKYFALNAILLVVTYFIGALLNSIWMADISKITLEATHLVHPATISHNLPFLLSFAAISMSYAALKYLFLTSNHVTLKKITYYGISALMVISLASYISYKIDTNYGGSEKIHFIEQRYTSLDSIIQLPQFKNKVVYVDLWYSSCSPCMNEFKYTGNLKKTLERHDVAFLYMGRETSHPNSKQRWKNMIRNKNLEGWHFYMTKQMANKLWKKILANQKEAVAAGYPRYILYDRQGKLVTYNAGKPSEGACTVQEIEALLKHDLAYHL